MSEEFIVARLAEVSAVTDLVGTRVYPGTAPTNCPRPYLVYTRITTPRVRSTKGLSGLASPRYQIDAWAATATEAKQVIAAVRAALDGYKGRLAGVRVLGVITADESSDSEIEAGLFRHRGEFVVWHNE
jgi:hypothetical protein